MRRGRLIVARPLALVEDRIGDLQRTIAFAALLGLLATAVVVWFVAARSLRPLATLRDQAASITTTRARVDEPGPAEVGEVAHSLNAMLARLEVSVAATERFTADAGHELRTPLTSVRANLAALRHGPTSRSWRSSSATWRGSPRSSTGCRRSPAATPARSRTSRSTSATWPTRRSPTRAAATRTWTSRSARRSELTVTGDESGLRAIFDNLLENAARHGARRVRIELVPTRWPSTTTAGHPGRPARAGVRALRAGRRAGSGLGLAIVAQQAALHGGGHSWRTPRSVARG